MPNKSKNISSPGKAKKKTYEYSFSLYVTGASPNSTRAITNISGLLQRHLPDQYELKIIDVYQQPLISASINIIALPLLIRTTPGPEKRLIGDMSDYQKILERLELPNIDPA